VSSFQPWTVPIDPDPFQFPLLFSPIFKKIRLGVQAKIAAASPVSRLVFRIAFQSQSKRVLAGRRRSKLADKLVFSKVQESTGGTIQFVTSASAPLAADSALFTVVALNVQLAEAYGLSEVSGAALVLPFKDFHFGTVGHPLDGVEVRLVDCPEVGYVAGGPEPHGEVQIRGPTVFSGYLNHPDITAQVIDGDGWFHTGDVGTITPTGHVRIVDRLGSIMKLQHGEWVVSEAVETVLRDAKLVDNICIYGNSHHDMLVAAVTPNMSRLRKITHSGPDVTDVQLLQLAGTQEAILADLGNAASAGKLRGFERVRWVVLDPVEWSADAGFITPTMKTRRKTIHPYYQTFFDALYAKDESAGVRVFTVKGREYGAVVDPRAALAMAAKGHEQ
jgi:long-chain acyl-CoA synthetase